MSYEQVRYNSYCLPVKCMKHKVRDLPFPILPDCVSYVRLGVSFDCVCPVSDSMCPFVSVLRQTGLCLLLTIRDGTVTYHPDDSGMSGIPPPDTVKQ